MFHHNADAAALGVFQAVKESPRGLRLRLQRGPGASRAGAGGRERRHRSAPCLSPGGPGAEGRHASSPRSSPSGSRAGWCGTMPNPALDSPGPRRAQGAGQGGCRLDRRRHPDRRRHVRLRCRRSRAGAAGTDGGAPPAARPRCPACPLGRMGCLPGRVSPHSRGAGRAKRRQRTAGREPGHGRRHRGGGGRVAGDDRRRYRRRAGRTGCPLLLVHHGLLWDGNVPLTGRRYRRVAALLEHDIALYAAHIPLDLHPRWATTWCSPSGSASRSEGWFGDYKGAPIGVWGHAPARLAPRRDALVAEVNHALGTLDSGCPTDCRRPRAGRPRRHHHRRRREA